MKRQVPLAASIGAVVVVVIAVLGFAWSSLTSNGESHNPNAGKPTKSNFRNFSRQAADSMTEQGYLEFLRQNRPDLSEAELKQKADNWWRIKSGGSGR